MIGPQQLYGFEVQLDQKIDPEEAITPQEFDYNIMQELKAKMVEDQKNPDRVIFEIPIDDRLFFDIEQALKDEATINRLAVDKPGLNRLENHKRLIVTENNPSPFVFRYIYYF